MVVLCDRGALDIGAYLFPHDWSATMTAAGVLPGDLLRRYHMVVHLITAADGAESFYTKANNTARSEDARGEDGPETGGGERGAATGADE